MNKNKIEYRKKVAELAKEVIRKELKFFDFLSEIGGKDWAYETGDKEVDELIDLLEHLPLGASQKYYEKIWLIIEKLEAKDESYR